MWAPAIRMWRLFALPSNVRNDAHCSARVAAPNKCRCRLRGWAVSSAHFLRMGTTFGLPSCAVLDSTIRCKRFGATFQRSPASVMTVTVFLL